MDLVGCLSRSVFALLCLALYGVPSAAAGLSAAADSMQGSPFAFDREPERNIAVFVGNTRLADARITTSYQCLYCVVTRGSQDFHFGSGNLSWIRAELWGGHLGAAFELSSTSNIAAVPNVNGARAVIGLNSVSIVPMLRMPFLATADMPDGRFHLYGGLGLDFVSWMSLEISIPGQPPLSAHLSGRYNSATPGTLMLVGAAWNQTRWGFFAEYRQLHTQIDYDGAINNFSLDPVRTAQVPIHMTQMIAGIKYRF